MDCFGWLCGWPGLNQVLQRQQREGMSHHVEQLHKAATDEVGTQKQADQDPQQDIAKATEDLTRTQKDSTADQLEQDLQQAKGADREPEASFKDRSQLVKA